MHFCCTDMTWWCSVTVTQHEMLLYQQNTNIIQAWRLKIVKKKLYNPGMQNTEEKKSGGYITSNKPQQGEPHAHVCVILLNAILVSKWHVVAVPEQGVLKQRR